VTRSTLFQANDRTIKQLKNAGGLRLIRNQTASNAIMEYDQSIDYITYLQYNRETLELTQIYTLLAKLFDGNVLETMINGMEINRPTDNPPLRSTDKGLILDLTYFLHQYKTSSIVIITAAIFKKPTETINSYKRIPPEINIMEYTCLLILKEKMDTLFLGFFMLFAAVTFGFLLRKYAGALH
jgi:hypothetical protein